MGFVKVTMEWRRGANGDEGTFVFSPVPFMTRVSPGKRTAEITVPLLDGAIVQNLGLAVREIILQGVLFNKTYSWDDLETQRNNLINGLGTGPGQLHLISPARHLQYNAQITTEGIRFDQQTRSNIQDYTITIIIPSAKELVVSETTQTINSDTTVT